VRIPEMLSTIYTFNSLFEILHRGSAWNCRGPCPPFNSLFEILVGMAFLAHERHHLNFQFSFWDSHPALEIQVSQALPLLSILFLRFLNKQPQLVR